jgi:hypothetical protein
MCLVKTDEVMLYWGWQGLMTFTDGGACMTRKMLKRIGLAILFGLIIFAIGFGLAILIRNRSNYVLSDILFVEGLIVVILSLMMSMKGNPSGASLSGMGQQNATQLSFYLNEVTRIEREQTDYYKKFLQHATLEITLVNISFLLGGVMLILFSILFA